GPDAGDRPGAQPQPGRGGGEVRDTAGAGAHALGPQLLTGLWEAVHAGEDAVEEHRAGQQHVQRRAVGGALGGQRVPVLAAGRLGRRRRGGPGMVAARARGRRDGRPVGGRRGGRRVFGGRRGRSGVGGRRGVLGVGGVGGAVGHHLATPSSIPRMKWRWRNRNRITVGRATMTAPAASRAVSEVYWPWKFASPSGAVRSLPLGAMTRAMRNSFQVHMNTSTSMVTIAGREAGTRIRTRACSGRAPSIAAASTRLVGVARNCARNQKVPKAIDCATWGIAIAR